jgi:hypothetical protein
LDKNKQLCNKIDLIIKRTFAKKYMNEPDLSSSAIKKYRNDKEIMELTIKQIIKDFALFGLYIDYESTLSYTWHHVYVELEKQIRSLLEANSAKILSLLYQIDIPEEKIIAQADKQQNRQLSEVVSEMIMEREIKKVLTRLYFKNPGRF